MKRPRALWREPCRMACDGKAGGWLTSSREGTVSDSEAVMLPAWGDRFSCRGLTVGRVQWFHEQLRVRSRAHVRTSGPALGSSAVPAFLGAWWLQVLCAGALHASQYLKGHVTTHTGFMVAGSRNSFPGQMTTGSS